MKLKLISVFQRAAWPQHRRNCASHAAAPASPNVSLRQLFPNGSFRSNDNEGGRAAGERESDIVSPTGTRSGLDSVFLPLHPSSPTSGSGLVFNSTQVWLQAEATYERNGPQAERPAPQLFHKVLFESLTTPQGAEDFCRQIHFHGFALLTLDKRQALVMMQGLKAADRFFRGNSDEKKEALRTPSFQGFTTPSPGLFECFEMKREEDRDPAFQWPDLPPNFRGALEVCRPVLLSIPGAL